MPVTGIIAEYNPFHNGHQFQINSIKKNNDDLVVIAMSGNWVQRGAPSIIDKYSRTQMALSAGADLVLELPVHISTGSAGDFALGGISLLNSLGCVNALCFGCETNDLSLIERLSEYLINETPSFSSALKINLKNGMSYPKARFEALKTCGNFSASELDFFNHPNNMLGLEYTIAIKRQNSHIKPLPIQRNGNNYNDNTLSSSKISSASAIRSSICNNNISGIRDHMPDYAYDIIKSYNFMDENAFSEALRYKLITENDFTIYQDVSRELSDRINNYKLSFTNTSSFIDSLKTKNLTYTHISRCLTHILLNIKNDICKECEYIRILGFRKDSEQLLGLIKNNSDKPLITKPSLAKSILDNNAYSHFMNDVTASMLYDSHNEFSTPLVII